MPSSSDDKPFSEPAQAIEYIPTEQQLREQYEAEEIQHFLHLFSNYVTEVRATDIPIIRQSKPDANSTDGHVENDQSRTNEVLPVRELEAAKSVSFAEMIALRFILPNLPPLQRSVPPFTLRRLQQTSERIYLIVQSIYLPFATNLLKLSTWDDRNRSLLYCMLFWTLWWNDLVLPALVLRTLYAICRRKVFPYPSVSELRKRQEEISQAGKFGDQVTARLSSSSGTFGAKEMWRLFRLITHGKTDKLQLSQKDKRKEINEDTEVIENVSDDVTIIEDPADEAGDFKRFGLQCLTDLADFHERVRNLFIWRRPVSSRTYCMLFILVFISTLLTPTKYLVKTGCFILGFLFWHVVPVLAALPPTDRNRLPPMLADIPTDAEYAMEMISRRVAEGLPVSPANVGKRHNKQSSITTEIEVGARTLRQQSDIGEGNTIDPAEWKKWSDRLNTGRSLAAQGKRLFTGRTVSNFVLNMISTSLINEYRILWLIQTCRPFPAQHNTTPGLIDLTSTTLNFTPLLSQTAKLVIPLASMKGVKKTTMLKGLDIIWNESNETGGEDQRNEKFMWIGGRDELFARLISVSGRNWMRV
ncbi:hypothetical protein BDQ17DRAFT_1229312 [Cyathus striatus]|nr:hypothetical protein BDQ17DRAFT_1229312 [Cyathus striatus]